MYKVEAIVREDKYEDVQDALKVIHVNGMTISQVMGCGTNQGYSRTVPPAAKWIFWLRQK